MTNSLASHLHPLLGRIVSATPTQSNFEVYLSLATQPYLSGHAVYGQPVLSSSSFVEMALAAVATTGVEVEMVVVKNYSVVSALLLPQTEPLPVRLTLTILSPTEFKFQVVSGTDDASRLHAVGQLQLAPNSPPPSIDLSALQAEFSSEISVTDHYQACQKRGIEYSGSFATIARLWQQGDEALAQVQLPESLRARANDYRIHPILLDAGPQVLWAALLGQSQHTYLTVGIERLRLYRRPTGSLWIRARLRPDNRADDPTIAADLQLLDTQGHLLLAVEGLQLKQVTPQQVSSSAPKTKQTLAIAATFTAEPLAEPLRFWLDELGIPAEIKFAPYHQLFQQLLAPDSLLNTNRAGVNLLLLRFEDWASTPIALQPVVSLAEQRQILADHTTYILPNGAVIASLNSYETDYLYEEIFVDAVYDHPDLTLPDNACVVDVGANIGIFSLFVLSRCPTARLLAVEPAPHTFAVLQANLALYSQQATPLNIGLADENHQADFTFYPHSSVFSGFHADTTVDEQAIRLAVRGRLSRSAATEFDAESIDQFTEQFLAGRLAQQTHRGQLRPLSDLIREQGLTHIDLLKIDAEKSELAILHGIEPEHWPLIRQLVMEVHDQTGDVLEAITSLLTTQNFSVEVKADALLGEVGFYTLLATRPQSEVKPPAPSLSQTVQEFAQSLRQAASRSAIPWLVVNCPGPNGSPPALAQTLVAELVDEPEVHLVSAGEIMDAYPVSQPFDPVADKAGHIPYTPNFFTALGTGVARKLYALTHPPIKVIVLDCDGTLWDGVCGEDGPAGVQLGPGQRALHQFMVAQYRAGTLLCLASKNHEADVWAVFDHRPEMPLRAEHFATWRINWQAKSTNLQDLSAELQIGLEQFAFIDDNPLECAEVQANCPAVLTLQLPTEAGQIGSWLSHIWAFDHLHRTAEDRQRTHLYRQNSQREAFRRETLSLADFLTGLGLTVKILPLTPAHLPRASQLTWRTNQFNFTTIRRTEAEIRQLYLTNERADGWVIYIKDRFGDYGLVGLLLGLFEDEALVVDTFLLSCRALGRGVEHRMLAHLGQVAQRRNLSQVRLTLHPTAKNQPAQIFLQSVVGPEQLFPGQPWQVNLPAANAAETIFRPAEQSVVGPTNPLPPTPADNNPQQRNLLLRRIVTELPNVAAIQQAIAYKHPPVRHNQPANLTPPGNQLEKTIAEIWAKLLNVRQVGVDDNFFDLNGTSLMLVQLTAQLYQIVGREVSPLELFKYPTVRTLAQYLDGMTPAQAVTGVSLSLQQSIKRAKKRRTARRRRIN